MSNFEFLKYFISLLICFTKAVSFQRQGTTKVDTKMFNIHELIWVVLVNSPYKFDMFILIDFKLWTTFLECEIFVAALVSALFTLVTIKPSCQFTNNHLTEQLFCHLFSSLWIIESWRETTSRTIVCYSYLYILLHPHLPLGSNWTSATTGFSSLAVTFVLSRFC